MPFVIGIPIYDGVDLLDVAVPYELFNWMAQCEREFLPDAPTRLVQLVSVDGREVSTRDGLRFSADLLLDKCGQLDLLWVPGGDPTRLQQLMLDARLMDFLRRQSLHAGHVASVCEGAMLLAAAGLLDGYRATTHWAFIACLRLFPHIHVADGYPRVVIDRDRITGGGISSGLDEALEVIALLANDEVAEKVQLSVQYQPHTRFDSGDPSVARPPVYQPDSNCQCGIPGMADTIRKVLHPSGA